MSVAVETTVATVWRLADEAAANRRARWLATAAVVAVPAVVGAVVALPFGAWPLGLGAGIVVGALLARLAPRVGERLALGALRAEPADADRHPRYHNLVRGLCEEAELPVPRLLIVEGGAANALALDGGPSGPTILVTGGLLERLNRVELEGVLAHQLARIRGSSARLGTTAVVLGGLPGLLLEAGRRGGAVAGLAGTALLPLAPLLRLTAPQRRVLHADESAAYLTRYPPGLASALRKLDAGQQAAAGIANPGLDHLWLLDPRPASAGAAPGPEPTGLRRFFRTHPSVQERLTALSEL